MIQKTAFEWVNELRQRRGMFCKKHGVKITGVVIIKKDVVAKPCGCILVKIKEVEPENE